MIRSKMNVFLLLCIFLASSIHTKASRTVRGQGVRRGHARVLEVEASKTSKSGKGKTESPTPVPSPVPTIVPSTDPTAGPTPTPSLTFSTQPSGVPSPAISNTPTNHPSGKPSLLASSNPSVVLSEHPTTNPTKEPTSLPSPNPTPSPTANSSPNPTSTPTENSSSQPSVRPSPAPSPRPSLEPEPSSNPSPKPTLGATPGPTAVTTSAPTLTSSVNPTDSTPAPSSKSFANPPVSTPSPTTLSSSNPTMGIPVTSVPSTLSSPSTQPTTTPSAAINIEPTAQPKTSSPSEAASVSPSLTFSSSQPTAEESQTPTSPNSQGNSQVFVRDPNDSNSWICPQGTGSTSESTILVDTQVDFVYHIWIEADKSTASVIVDVEDKLAEAVATELLTCNEERRRLLDGVVSVSSSPADSESGSCATECHIVNGYVTIQSNGGSTASDIYCEAIGAVAKAATLTNIATATDGVEGLQFISSPISCPSQASGSDANDVDDADDVDNSNSDVDSLNRDIQTSDGSTTLRTGVSAAIAGVGLILFVSLFVLVQRHRSNLDEAAQDKDLFSIPPNPTGLSSPSSARYSDVDDHLVDVGTLMEVRGLEFDEDEPDLEDIELDQEGAVLLGAQAPPDSPGWREGHREESSARSDVSDDEDLQSLMEDAEPVQISYVPRPKKKTRSRKKIIEQSYQSCVASSPPMTPIKEDDSSTSTSNTNDVTAPLEPKSLLGDCDREEDNLDDIAMDNDDDEDESPRVVQIVDGDVKMLSLKDIEAENLSDSDESSI